MTPEIDVADEKAYATEKRILRALRSQTNDPSEIKRIEDQIFALTTRHMAATRSATRKFESSTLSVGSLVSTAVEPKAVILKEGERPHLRKLEYNGTPDWQRQQDGDD